jgi:hypothetical protein
MKLRTLLTGTLAYCLAYHHLADSRRSTTRRELAAYTALEAAQWDE